MMETTRLRGSSSKSFKIHNTTRKPPHSKNKRWVADHLATNETDGVASHGNVDRRNTGELRGGRGTSDVHKSRNKAIVFTHASMKGGEESGGEGGTDAESEEDELQYHEEPEFETAEAREKFYQELVKAREAERKNAIAEGKMDDPNVPKRLDEAITMVGTCMDMCPRFERYRRERENNLDKWETIPGTRRVDHSRAVKAYERAAGDKTIPSDLRPPYVLKKTLDYLFHKLLPKGGFEATHTFIRDRSRAVRTDFTMQHETGPLAIECHDRCARYHILALHFMREKQDFSIALEEQQLMNTLQSLKEFYEDQRQRYQSPTELEMRVYHRLIHIRDQRERHDDIPPDILSHPVFKLTTQFRLIVQAKSSPITKTSPLVVDAEAMGVFGELAAVLRESGNVVMIYLVACILERLFGKDTIDDIEAIRGDLSIPDVIDGADATGFVYEDAGGIEETQEPSASNVNSPAEVEPLQPENSAPVSIFGSSSSSVFGQLPKPVNVFGSTNGFTAATPTPPPAGSAFSSLKPTPNAFSNTHAFGGSVFGPPTSSVFGSVEPAASMSHSSSLFGGTKSNASAAQTAFATATTTQTPAPSSSIFGATTETTAPPKNMFGAPSSVTTPPPVANGAATTAPAASSASTWTSSSPPLLFPASKRKSLPASENVFATPKAPPSSISLLEESSQTPPSLFGTAKSSPQPPSQASSVSQLGTPATSSLNPSAPVFTSSKSATEQSSVPSPPAPSTSFKPQPSSTTARPSLFVSTNVNGTSASVNGSRPSLTRQPTIILDKPETPTGWPRLEVEEPRTPLSQPPTPVKFKPVSLPPTPSASLDDIPKRLKGFPSISTDVPTVNGSLSPLFGSPMKSPTKAGPSFSVPPPPLTSNALSVRDVGRPFPDSPADPFAKPVTRSNKSKGNEKEETEPSEEQVRKAVVHRDTVMLRSAFKHWYHAATNPFLADRKDGRRPKRDRVPLRPLSRAESEESAVTTASASSRVRRRRKPRPSMPDEILRTDEDVVRRLRETRDEYERRWAQGSFLSILRTTITKKTKIGPRLWNVWLSMNPDVDSTAIWVQQKFNVPDSGHWLSENSFEIPYSAEQNGNRSPSSPALLVFECTPIADVDDDLERKYRVLDDYGRLRDILDNFPNAQHYSTSVIFIIWAEEEQKDLYKDIFQIVEMRTSDQSFSDCRALFITSGTKDLDQKFSDLLTAMSLDVEGRLSQSFAPEGLLAPFLQLWKKQGKDWVELCSLHGQFDYELFGQAMQRLILLLATIFHHLSSLLSQPSLVLNIPALGEAKESNEFYDRAAQWLESGAWKGTTKDAIADLQAYRSNELDFPAQILLENIGSIVPTVLRAYLPSDLVWPLLVPNAQLEANIKDFHESIRWKANEFDDLLVRRPFNPSPSKRRITEDHSDLMSSSLSSKRLKTSNGVISSSSAESLTSNGSQTTGRRTSPSPSVTSVTTADGSPVITLAMLRARTREVRQKYYIP